MPGSRRRARRARANLLVPVAVMALAVACAPAPYEGIPDTTTGPDAGPAASTVTTTARTPTTAPPTTALAPTTVPPPSTTRSEPATTTRPVPTTTTTTRSPAPGAQLGGTGVRITLAEPWQIAPGVDPRTLLPAIAEPLAAAGLFARPALVATRRDTTGPFTPSLMAFEFPRGTAPDAAASLAALRAAVGRTAAASEPLPEPSRIGEGAYITYQYTATVNGTAIEIVSEHYAFVRPASVLVVTATTTVDRAPVDGRAFGNMLASLALTS